MNLSLRNRVAFSFIVANIVVLLITFTVFQFLNALNTEGAKRPQIKTVFLLNFEIRVSTIKILKFQREMLIKGVDEAIVKKLTESSELLKVQLQRLDGLQKIRISKVILLKCSLILIH